MSETPPRKRIGLMRLAITTVVLAVLAVTWGLFMRGSLRAMEVESGSMEPTLLAHDRVIVRDAKPEDLRRGAIVTIIPPNDDGPDLVKRIVAMPGDSIAFKDGIFYVNGEPSPPPGSPSFRYEVSQNQELKLGPEEYYVLGDNREKSLDSQEFGPVSRNVVNGVLIYRYSPRSRMGAVE